MGYYAAVTKRGDLYVPMRKVPGREYVWLERLDLTDTVWIPARSSPPPGGLHSHGDQAEGGRGKAQHLACALSLSSARPWPNRVSILRGETVSAQD